MDQLRGELSWDEPRVAQLTSILRGCVFVPLRGSLVDDARAALLAEALAAARNVRILHLNDTRVTSVGAAALCEYLRSDQLLRILHVDDNLGLDSGAILGIVDALQSSQVHSVSLSCYAAVSVPELVSRLNCNPRIHDVRIRVPSMGASDVYSLTGELLHVRSLSLLYPRIRPDELAQALRGLRSSVRKLAVTGSSAHIAPEEWEHADWDELGLAIANLSSLRTLALTVMGLRDSAASAIARHLKHSRGILHQLDLSTNHIGDQGAASFAEVIPALGALSHLNLRDTDISFEGASRMLDALGQPSALCTVAMSGYDDELDPLNKCIAAKRAVRQAQRRRVVKWAVMARRR